MPNGEITATPRKVREDIRNVVIVAHVDHGKTTLVDAMLKQSKIFRDNQQVGEQILDSNPLERERGITILAKNTAVIYKGIKINIIDTPGHADFSGEVERVVNMADGCLLLVDAAEGPMPQTRFVLRQTLARGHKLIVVVNKVDRSDARTGEVLSLTQDLFLELATEPEQLDFPVFYAIGRDGVASTDPKNLGRSLIPLFEALINEVPPPRIEEGPFQMLVTNLDYDTHKGKIAIGRIFRGSVTRHDIVAVVDSKHNITPFRVEGVFTFLGLGRETVESASAGDIVAITGLDKVSIGDTVASSDRPEALPGISISEPTVKMTFLVNDSPFAGREGKYCTSRHLRERLYRELETNLSLRVQDTDSPDAFLVSGRGELHLSILIETMRREGYEFQVSRPEAITRMVNGQLMEPVEMLTIDTREVNIGVLTEMLSRRLARVANMQADGKGNVRMEYRIPTRGLIGFRSEFLTATRGDGVTNTMFIGYEPWHGEMVSARDGVLIAAETGTAVTYGLNVAQGRGVTFIKPGTAVYEGMIIGMNSRANDIEINVCKEKKLTNVRASTADIAIKLSPPVEFSLEESLSFINDDELVEVTPKSLRLRKKLLTQLQRVRSGRVGRVVVE
ncbi:MAG: translational GTPase TypA [Chloroflexota bacterium]